MKPSHIRQTAAALALAATVLAPLQATRAAGGMLLRAHFAVGQHYSAVETKVDTMTLAMKITVGSNPAQKVAQTSHEKDVIPSTETIVKVYPDGSALRRITYGTVIVTSDGKTTSSAMKGYYEEDHISTRLRTISSKVYGAAGIPAAVLSAVGGDTSATNQTANYPEGPVSVGSTWPVSAAIAEVGKLAAQVTLLGFGTQAGRQTVTIRLALSQPVHVTNQGLSFGGPMTGFEKATIFIDTGENASTSQGGFSWKGKLSGTTSGAKASGSFNFSETDTTAPAM